MFVSMWMTKDPITITAEVGFDEIQTILKEKHLRRLPVVDNEGHLIGLIQSGSAILDTTSKVPVLHIGDDELHTKGSELSLTAASIMTPLDRLHTTEPERPIEEVARIMSDNKIGVLPVIRKGQLAGIITDTDVFHALTTIFNPGTNGVRITFDNASGEDVFPLISEVTHQHRLRVMSFVSMHKHERPLCVVQVTGPERGIEAMLNDIWKSHHQVVSVVHLAENTTV
jgi:acetoin utilization protein AcuB